jgi:hypothetical protein
VGEGFVKEGNDFFPLVEMNWTRDIRRKSREIMMPILYTDFSFACSHSHEEGDNSFFPHQFNLLLPQTYHFSNLKYDKNEIIFFLFPASLFFQAKMRQFCARWREKRTFYSKQYMW